MPHRNGPSGRPENGIQPHGSSFFGNRGRIDAVAHAADQTATFGHSGGPGHPYPWPPMATTWPPMATTWPTTWPPMATTWPPHGHPKLDEHLPTAAELAAGEYKNL